MTDEAFELKLYIENDGTLHRRQGEPILKNLAAKKAKGVYDHDEAVKIYMHLMESGAKKYAKEFGGTWNQLFSVADRKSAAKAFVGDFEAEYKLGNYSHLIPKQYQPKAPVKRRVAAKRPLPTSKPTPRRR